MADDESRDQVEVVRKAARWWVANTSGVQLETLHPLEQAYALSNARAALAAVDHFALLSELARLRAVAEAAERLRDCPNPIRKNRSSLWHACGVCRNCVLDDALALLHAPEGPLDEGIGHD